MKALAQSAITMLATTAFAATVQAQAWTPPKGTGSVTLAWQWIENTGHILTDGFDLKEGQSVSHSLYAEVEYALTDDLAASLGIPYVFSKYTGKGPTPAALPIDMNRQWNSGLQDFSFGIRRRLTRGALTLTPGLAYVQPSHAYVYQGEAVPGRRLREAQLSLNVGHQIAALPGAYVQGRYSYAFVQRVLEVKNDRSNLSLEIGGTIGPRVGVRGLGLWQHTHGGLRVGSPTGNPYPPFSPTGDISSEALFDEHDRMLRDNNWRLGLGTSVRLGRTDLSAFAVRYLGGQDTHSGYSVSMAASWYFATRQSSSSPPSP